MNDDNFKKIFNLAVEKLANNPEEFFDNDKLQKKYNEKLKENVKLKKQLEAYENMRKELINFIEEHKIKDYYGMEFINTDVNNLLNILNKVGSDK